MHIVVPGHPITSPSKYDTGTQYQLTFAAGLLHNAKYSQGGKSIGGKFIVASVAAGSIWLHEGSLLKLVSIPSSTFNDSFSLNCTFTTACGEGIALDSLDVGIPSENPVFNLPTGANQEKPIQLGLALASIWNTC